MLKKATALFLFLCFSLLLIGQDEVELELLRKYAKNGFRDGDYDFALSNYLELYALDQQNIDLNYKIGICYTETTIDKSKAIPFLEFVVGHNNIPINSFYYLGRAYMYNYRFTMAVEAFYEYKMGGVSEETIRESDRLISMCYDALNRINVPKNVSFELLGSEINSEQNDYYPFADASGEKLVFSSNRTYVEDYEEYIANVFYSDKKGVWSPAAPLPVNTYDNEEIVGMTPSGEKLLVYANGDYSTHDIKMINRKGSKFSNADNSELPFDMNTEGIEMGACLSPNGNTMYFASDKRGGRGGLDLYIAKKDASGVWMAAQPLSDRINTEYDENFPSLSPDGKILYFASKGHPGVGEYDIYSTSYVEALKQWSNPINLGFPINTPLDNTTISFLPDGKTAYIAANRKEGIGKLDVYKVTFGDDNQSVIYMISVMVGTETSNVPYSEDFLRAYATFYDEYDNIIGQYSIEDGNVFATLFPGTYKLKVKFDGYDTGHQETVTIGQDNVGDYISTTVYLKQ
ncbi:MAG: hypothetical protein PF517_11245 [Salinivirgaceae bacterium]|jgi:hypothetical protein|nr:hypothetical protein [Salinivirgaceae bacterium]